MKKGLTILPVLIMMFVSAHSQVKDFYSVESSTNRVDSINIKKTHLLSVDISPISINDNERVLDKKAVITKQDSKDRTNSKSITHHKLSAIPIDDSKPESNKIKIQKRTVLANDVGEKSNRKQVKISLLKIHEE